MYNQIEESFEEVNLIMLKKFIEFTKSIISTSEFMERFRRSKKDFTRNRKVSFAMNILLIFACEFFRTHIMKIPSIYKGLLTKNPVCFNRHYSLFKQTGFF